jgi:hypothetical protein
MPGLPCIANHRAAGTTRGAPGNVSRPGLLLPARTQRGSRACYSLSYLNDSRTLVR